MDPARHTVSFSVVIPVYNGADTICRAVDSVLQQRLSPIQVIVADDASTDDTVGILKRKYGDSILVVEMKTNGGPAAARNKGIEAATGDYIAFLDDDDIWHTDKLTIVADAIAVQPDAHLIFHYYTLHDFDAHIGRNVPPPVSVRFSQLLPGNFISTSCAVIRNGQGYRFDTDMRYTEDYDLWLRIVYSQPAYGIDQNLTRLFRGITSPGGISSNTWLMRVGEMKAYTHLVKLNVLFGLAVPFLVLWSLAKHLFKLIIRS